MRFRIAAMATALTVAWMGLNTPTPGQAQTGTQSWQEIVAAAKREGSLTIAGHPSDLRRAAFLAFQQAYPEIKIEYVSIGSHGQADSRLKAEWEAKVFGWDILSSGEQFIYNELAPNGALVSIRDVIAQRDIMDDKNWKDGFNAGFLDKEHAYVYGFMIYIAEIAYVNTSTYPLSQFKSVNDLLEQQYQGKIAWVDPRTGGVPEIMTSFVYHRLGEKGLRYLLTEQKPHMVGSSRQLLDAMLRSGTPIGIGVTTGTLEQMLAAGMGENIQRIDFPDGRYVGRSGGFIAIPKTAPHPNAAKVFANWIFRKKGKLAGLSWRRRIRQGSTLTSRIHVDTRTPSRNGSLGTKKRLIS